MATAVRSFMTLVLGIVVGGALVLGYLETHPGFGSPPSARAPMMVSAQVPVPSASLERPRSANVSG